MASIPPIDILVVTHNAKKMLGRCLRSVIRHTRDFPYQLTVVDNASRDGTGAYLKNYFSGTCRVIRSDRNLGFSGGANLALRSTRRPWVALLDDDVEVTPGWLDKLNEAARKQTKVAIVGGKVVFPDSHLFCAEFSIVPSRLVGWREPDRGQRDYTREVDALPGPCWLMRRSVIKKVGFFDERFFPSQCEDIDYCVRVRLAGYKILYHGKVKIIHHHLYRTGSAERTRINDLKFLKKWGMTLNRFPLCPLSSDERLIAEGSKIFEKEKFLSHCWVLGNSNRLIRRLPEAFYKGVAFWSGGEIKKAQGVFLKALKAFKIKTASVNRGRAYLYLLSIYFQRLDMKKESDRCLRRVQKLSYSGNNPR